MCGCSAVGNSMEVFCCRLLFVSGGRLRVSIAKPVMVWKPQAFMCLGFTWVTIH